MRLVVEAFTLSTKAALEELCPFVVRPEQLCARESDQSVRSGRLQVTRSVVACTEPCVRSRFPSVG